MPFPEPQANPPRSDADSAQGPRPEVSHYCPEPGTTGTQASPPPLVSPHRPATELSALATPANCDPLTSNASPTTAAPSTSVSLINTIRFGLGSLGSFTRGLVTEDWIAAPISFFVAAVPSNLFTAWTVSILAPHMATVFGQDTAGYFACTSIAALVVGYASYISTYYSAMAYRERDKFRTETGSFDTRQFLKTVMIDNGLHLLTDLYHASAVGLGQLTLVATGQTDLFWSILATQMVGDLWESIYEPLYWRSSKHLASDQQTQTFFSALFARFRTEPANSDTNTTLKCEARHSGSEESQASKAEIGNL